MLWDEKGTNPFYCLGSVIQRRWGDGMRRKRVIWAKARRVYYSIVIYALKSVVNKQYRYVLPLTPSRFIGMETIREYYFKGL